MPKKILYFVDGPYPTQKDRDAAEKLGTARFRNARVAAAEGIEPCDEVAGAVPDSYKQAKGVKVLSAPAASGGSKEPEPKAPAK